MRRLNPDPPATLGSFVWRGSDGGSGGGFGDSGFASARNQHSGDCTGDGRVAQHCAAVPEGRASGALQAAPSAQDKAGPVQELPRAAYRCGGPGADPGERPLVGELRERGYAGGYTTVKVASLKPMA